MPRMAWWVIWLTRLRTVSAGRLRMAAMAGAWRRAFSSEMSGSRPEPELVTASAGTGPGPKGLVWAATRCLMLVSSAALVGARLEAPDSLASYGVGMVLPLASVPVSAEGRGWKYFGEVKFCPIRAE